MKRIAINRLDNKVMINFIKITDLMGKLNTLLATMKNPYLLTYLLEMVDTINSNQIESIHTTVDEAYESVIENNNQHPYVRYREALKNAHKSLLINEIIRPRDIEKINNILRANNEGFRKTPANIKDSTGKIVHKTANAIEIPSLIVDLTYDINSDKTDQLRIIDALLIHHKFESIHPFGDGNGRTGRILLALLFVKFDLMNVPITSFSFALNNEKQLYYKALKAADNNDFNTYLLIMSDMLVKSFEVSLSFVKDYLQKLKQVQDMEWNIKNKEEFIAWVFAGVKVSNKYLQSKTKLNNKTITKYIKELSDASIVEVETKGIYRPYKNLVVEQLINKYFKM